MRDTASFAHKGGVHADAASKSTRSYEHIDPAIVGNRTGFGIRYVRTKQHYDEG